MNIKVFASSSSGNCYLLQSGGINFLLDCGIKKNELITKLAQEKLTITDLEFCLISHEHNDHSALSEYLSKFINVYSCYSNEYVKKIDSNKLLKIGNIRIIPFNVKHGKTENYGYIINDGIDNLLFATDCNLIEYNFSIPFTKIMIECNYMDSLLDMDNEKEIRQANTHMSLENLKIHLSRMNLHHCKEIYLLHLSDECSDEKIMQAQIQSLTHCKTNIALKKGGVNYGPSQMD